MNWQNCYRTGEFSRTSTPPTGTPPPQTWRWASEPTTSPIPRPGYAGIPSELYSDPKTGTYLADATAALTEITAAIKTLVSG
jgi:hypothetical protein